MLKSNKWKSEKYKFNVLFKEAHVQTSLILLILSAG